MGESLWERERVCGERVCGRDRECGIESGWERECLRECGRERGWEREYVWERERKCGGKVEREARAGG